MIETMKEEIQQFLTDANDIQIISLHRYSIRLKYKDVNVFNYNQILELKPKIVKDWWTNLTAENIAAIDGAISELDNKKDINKIKISKLSPEMFEQFIWANSAITSFNQIIEQFEADSKNTKSLANYTESTLELLKIQPQLGETTVNKADVRIIKIIYRIKVVYRISQQGNKIELIQFLKC